MSFLSNIPIVGTVASGLQQAWNDFSGKTATNISAKAAEENTNKQIAWEKERATSAHQWEIQDMEKAGLNPILSAGGSGATTGGITPQMPDVSQYKGYGILLPIISTMYDNILKTANSASATANAKLANEKVFTEKTNQLMNMYTTGLINKQTLLKGVEIEEAKLNLSWLPYEKGVGIAKDVASSLMPFAVMGGTARAATRLTKTLSKEIKGLGKKINNPWRSLGKGNGKINIYTGEIKGGKLKPVKLKIIKPKG